MTTNSTTRRTNMLQRRVEHWRPPLLRPGTTPLGSLAFSVRRFLDLQVGSIWADLAPELKSARGRFLDVGCGAQPYRSLLHPDVQYIGLDTVDAKSHFGYDAPDTLYLSGDSWPVETGSIDVLLCTETLEHVPDSARFLAEASRCICDGGRLILTVPFAARWHFIPYDYWRFTPSGLEWLLENAGFAAIRVFARGNALTVACYKSMALILPMLFPREASIALSWMLRLFGLILSPLLLLLALVANLSLRGAGGDDCLGYTVLATRSSQPPSAAAREAVHES